MRLYLAPDSDLRAFTGAPKTLQKWLRQRRVLADMWLQEHWRDMDAILAERAASHGGHSPLTPAGADFTYPGAADHGAHALDSTSTERLLSTLQDIARPELEAHLGRRLAAEPDAGGATAAPDPARLAAETEALVAHFACLEEACKLAVSKRYGLLMALWELGPATD